MRVRSVNCVGRGGLGDGSRMALRSEFSALERGWGVAGRQGDGRERKGGCDVKGNRQYNCVGR